MLGGPPLLRVRVVAPGAGDGRRPAVESEEEPVSAVRAAPAGRLLSNRVRAAAPAQRGRGCVPPSRSEPLYRLVTSVLAERLRRLAALYHERWEIETASRVEDTPARGADGAAQHAGVGQAGVLGLLLAHYAVRKLMHEAAPPGCGLPVVPAHGPRGPSQAAAVRRCGQAGAV